jgi:hypothetical protein
VDESQNRPCRHLDVGDARGRNLGSTWRAGSNAPCSPGADVEEMAAHVPADSAADAAAGLVTARTAGEAMAGPTSRTGASW